MTILFESYRAITAGGSSPFDTGEGRALTCRSFPRSQRGEDSVEAVGQGRRSWLQDERRLDLDDAAIPYCRDRIPSGSLSDLVQNDLLAAPRGDNDVGRRSDHVMWRDNSVFGSLLISQFRKHILATGDLDEFRDPANAADERIVPLLEINLLLPSPANRRRHLAKASFVTLGKPFRLIYRSDQSADGADHRENARDIALIESMDGNACADQLCRDLRLEIGEGEDEVRLERADLRNIGRGEGRNARLLAPGLRGPHGKTV